MSKHTGELQTKPWEPEIGRKHPVYWWNSEDIHTSQRKIWTNYFLICNFFTTYIGIFFSFLFHFFVFFFTFTISCLQVILLVVYFTSLLHYSQVFYPFAICDNSKSLHNKWSIFLYFTLLFSGSSHTSLPFSLSSCPLISSLAILFLLPNFNS
jgi:hypothetical protein